MKYLGAMLITLALIVFLLINGTTTGFNTSSIVSVPYDFLTASEKREVDCLTENIFYEAAHEPHDGKVAVGLVTLNRVKTNAFGKDVCGVVHQKTKHRTGKVVCQFSWLCESKKVLTEKHMELYNNVREVALYVYFNHGIIDDVTQGAIYYHADYVSPGWNKLQKTTQIGRHIFYIDPKVSSRYDGKT